MEKEVKVGEKTFKVREILAVETDDFNWEDTKEVRKKQLMLATGLSEDEYNKLTMKERLCILRAYNELNMLTDENFTSPAKKEDSLKTD